jgi:hypothetical protein
MAKKPAAPAAAADGSTVVECVISNVWTSKGKLFEGETMEVPADEAALLLKNKQVRVKK